MRIRWTPAAAADLEHISDYLKDHHPHYQQPTIRKLYEAIRSLKHFPRRGRPGREKGTREIRISPALCRRLSREKGEHRSSAHLSPRTGPLNVSKRPVDRGDIRK